MSSRILRLPEVIRQSGNTRSTIYLRIQQGLWTKPVSLGGRVVGWPENEVTAINSARIAGLSENEIASLVTQLEIARKSAA